MNNVNLSQNPFSVTTPEDMSAKDACSLFVNVLPDFPMVLSPGHAFLHGPRGSGKSMIFRYLQPDCQCIAKRAEITQLPFFAIYIPLKQTDFTITEIRRLEGKHANKALNCHLLTMHLTEIIFEALRKTPFPNQTGQSLKDVCDVVELFGRLIKQWGWQGKCPKVDHITSITNAFESMRDTCKEVYAHLKLYLQKLSFSTEIVPYDGPLTDYTDFLFPLLRKINILQCMPDGPIYLLLDDADRLSKTQTQALNSWVDTRTSNIVSLKISAQHHKYKTRYTFASTRIDTPHDYSDIDISTIYTTSFKDKYKVRVAAIANKRLALAGIDATVDQFFPEDKEQEDEIRRIAEELRQTHLKGEGRGYRASDDAVRYARPDYIKRLSGTSKSAATYCYAGFNQLVHVSSGIIRHFLEPAAKMYSETAVKSDGKPVTLIPPGIQNSVLKEMANAFLFDELDKESQDVSSEAPPAEDLAKLANLIEALGGLFHQCLLSDRAERRVFSIAFSDAPSPEILKILRLGVRYGYFQESTIGKKDSKSSGRTQLYILSRRLAPAFNLDPTGFAGYLFVTSNFIDKALTNPRAVLRRVARTEITGDIEPPQLTLF